MQLRNILLTTTVGQLALKAVPILAPADSVSTAAAHMRQHSHGSALICEQGKLAGVFTERDLLKVIASGSDLAIPLAEVMTAQPQTVSADDNLLKVIQLLDQGGYRRLPVVNSSGVPVGIVDVKSVSHFLVEHFPAGVYNQTSHALQHSREREGA